MQGPFLKPFTVPYYAMSNWRYGNSHAHWKPCFLYPEVFQKKMHEMVFPVFGGECFYSLALCVDLCPIILVTKLLYWHTKLMSVTFVENMWRKASEFLCAAVVVTKMLICLLCNSNTFLLYSWEWILSSAADFWTPCRCGNHEVETHTYPTE